MTNPLKKEISEIIPFKKTSNKSKQGNENPLKTSRL